jgi:hypothetical protein
VRKRAVQSIAEIPNGEATALLQDALANSDIVVRQVCSSGARGTWSSRHGALLH